MSLLTPNLIGLGSPEPPPPAPELRSEPRLPQMPPIPPRDVQAVSDQRLIHRLLFAFDLVLVWASALVTEGLLGMLAAVHLAAPQALLQPKKIGALLLFSLLVVLFMQLQRDYVQFWKKSIGHESQLLAKAILAAAIVTKSCVYLFGITIGVGLPALAAVAFSWALLVGWRRLLLSQPIEGLTEKRNVLIVGCGPNGKLLRDYVESHPELGYVFKGYVDRRQAGKRPDPQRNREEGFIVGPVNKLEAVVRENFIDEVLVSVPADRYLVRLVALNASKAGVPVRVVPDLYDGLALGQPFESVGQFPTLTIHQRAIPTFQLIIKRLVDLAASAIALVLLLPFMVCVAILVKLDSPGPVLYESFRVGKKGQTFVCYKFRTMSDKADELQESLAHLNERQGLLFKISADPRITRVGRVLRKYSIDELPQLWNVLKGDMSLVGPRPPLPREYNKYAIDHLCRLDVTPGVTGLWQVQARQDPSFENYIELDKSYVNNWSLSLDFEILWKTIAVVIGGTGQ